MGNWLFILAAALALSSFVAEAGVVNYTFNVGNVKMRRVCTDSVVTAVNGQVPGPTIYVREGDHLTVKVVNESPYNITIHWHGVSQIRSPWADGSEWLTQCPIQPGGIYTYKFMITGQEGTVFWHAHSGLIRSTVYGAIVILPRQGSKGYPFPKPYKEFPILLGEWWKKNIVDLEKGYIMAGSVPDKSDASTINGQPGVLHPCSHKHIYEMEVEYGKTYLLRVINAAPESQYFFKVAGHHFTVVGIDASYTTPYSTDVLLIAPGQTVDALMLADAVPSHYYMAAQPYVSIPESIPLSYTDAVTATALVIYKYSGVSSSSAKPVMPLLPNLYDTATAHRFYSNLTSLLRPGGAPVVPKHVDEHMLVTFGMGYVPCDASQTTCNISTGAVAASMNNVSFQLPTRSAMLQAKYYSLDGIYTRDFPNKPPVEFDYTSNDNNNNAALMPTVKATRVKTVKFNTTVEVVLQNTALIGTENHPFHLHGFSFFVLAMGFGNYKAATAAEHYNLVNPQLRNTVTVPKGGWTVIRFVADNPGVWFMHCHVDFHMQLGMAMAFEVEDGPTDDCKVPPPPRDCPLCSN